MDDDDIEEIFYTPLKRHKIKDDNFGKSSQVTYSTVSSQIRGKRPTQRQNQRKRNQSQISKSSKVKKSPLQRNQNLSRISNSTPVKKSSPFKRPVSPKISQKPKIKSLPFKSDTNSPVSFKKSIDSYFKTKDSQKVNISSSNIENNKSFMNGIDENENVKSKQLNEVEEEIPDLDFSQLNDAASSDESVKEHSLSPRTEDFYHKEQVIKVDNEKVDSWLCKSVEQNLISNIEVENDECDDNSRGNTQNSHKTCLHLHFHVNSPQKFVQPTLDHFFKKSTTCVKSTRPEVKLKQQESNSKEVLKTWQYIMKPKPTLLQSEPGPSGVNQNCRNSEKQTEITEKVNKKCPFYKFIEDTKFVVDGFNYGHIPGISRYFLSHFHHDHYMGLSKNFKKKIYCSHITANLIRLKLKVEERFIEPLPLEQPRVIDGVEVTLYDSNHCPGAVMFLFKLTSGKVILHVGDFRAHPDMESISSFWNRSINVLYLDTTYLDACYDFLSQEEILEKCRCIAEEHSQFTRQTLFVVGSYTIGKEKVFKSIASKLDCKIYAEPYKEKILRCLNDQEINLRLTKNKTDAQVHVINMRNLSLIKLKKYMEEMQNRFKALVAIKPTGWEHNSDVECDLSNLKPKQTGNIYIYGLSYSEHSSYSELRRFVQFIQPEKIIPTVNNGNKNVRLKMERILQEWIQESRKTFSKKKNGLVT